MRWARLHGVAANRHASPRPSSLNSSTRHRGLRSAGAQERRAEHSRPFGLIGTLILTVLAAACASVAAAGPVPVRVGAISRSRQHRSGPTDDIRRNPRRADDERGPRHRGPRHPSMCVTWRIRARSPLPSRAFAPTEFLVVIGAYSSQLSIRPRQPCRRAGMVYWETVQLLIG